jgi:PHD/YefM family antitoxin component YafN of YafNO toxin-antitoxin module
VDQMSEDGVLLTEEDRALLLKVSSLLEEIIETFDVLRDEETMRSVREAEEDLRAGRVRGYGEFIEELKKSGKI